ncbi:uncharacterized protein LOC134266302 [Saccostrea cucullata]|uniref:uncharacterized protein LOC134266302 n=1 Tax=Saccostrea cuccullata TaxID=36930 RepID=UPI002ED24D0B
MKRGKLPVRGGVRVHSHTTKELSTNIPTNTNDVKELSNDIPTNTDEFKVYMIIGICIFGAFLIVIGVIIVKRHRSSASKEQISRIEPTGTDGLVNPSTKKAPDNAYTPMPLGSLGSVFPSNVDENVKAVYVECPDNVYDISRIHRPHVLQQNNIYQTNESIYNTTFAKKDYDINNDSNPYQSCVKQHLIKQNKD